MTTLAQGQRPQASLRLLPRGRQGREQGEDAATQGGHHEENRERVTTRGEDIRRQISSIHIHVCILLTTSKRIGILICPFLICTFTR